MLRGWGGFLPHLPFPHPYPPTPPPGSSSQGGHNTAMTHRAPSSPSGSVSFFISFFVSESLSEELVSLWCQTDLQAKPESTTF